MNTKLLHNSFNAGEISPELFGRPDTQQFRFGAAKARNWMTRHSGAAQLRPGFEGISLLDSKARLVPYQDDADDYMITMEAGKFRLFRGGLPISVRGGEDDVFLVGDQTLEGNLDLENDVIYTARPHNIATGDLVRTVTVGGTEPGGTSGAFAYYAVRQGPYGLSLKVTVVGPNDFDALSTTTLTDSSEAWVMNTYVGRSVAIYDATGAHQGFRTITANTATTLTFEAFDAVPSTGSYRILLDVDITSTNSGTLYIWRDEGLPDDYSLPLSLVSTALPYAVSATTNTFSVFQLSDDPGWPVGTGWKWDGAGTPPTTRSYARGDIEVPYDGREFVVVENTSIVSGFAGAQVSPVEGTELFSICAVASTGSFTPPVSAARKYAAGTVLWLRSTVGSFSAFDFIRAKTDVYASASGPSSADWELVPAPWLEIPNNYTLAELPQVTFAQTANRIRFAHRNHPTLEIYREAGVWSYRNPLATATPALAPTVTPFRGAEVGIDSSTAARMIATGHTGLGPGDLVYVLGTDVVVEGEGFYVIGLVAASGLHIEELLRLDGVRATFLVNASPTNTTLIPIDSTADSNSRYIITAVDKNGREFARSEATDPVFNLLRNSESYNTISWTTTTEASAYRIYKETDGTELFGFIAEAGAPPFDDRNIPPDFGVLAPEIDGELQLDYPGAVAFYDQRGVFGGNTAKPQGLWLSSLGRDSELVTRRTQLDTDRIALTIASRESQSVRHIVPVSELLVLTNSASWALTTKNTDSLTPTSATIRSQTTEGASYVRPLVMNNSVLYASEGNYIYRLSYQLAENSFGGINMSVRAAHLFDDYDLIDSAATKSRLAAAWFSDTAGRILGMSYDEQEQVAGWHVHTLDNYNVVSVGAAREGSEDRLYAVVENGGNYTLVRMQPSNIRSVMSSAHLDLCVNRNQQDPHTSSLTVYGPRVVGGTLQIFSANEAFDFNVVGESLFFPAEGLTATIASRASSSEITAVVVDPGTSTPTTASSYGITLGRARHLYTLAATTQTALLQKLDGTYEIREVTVATDGTAQLPYPCRAFHIGQTYSNELRTMPVTAQMESEGMGRVKAISHAYIRLFETAGLKVGPDLSSLSELYPDDWTLRSEESRELIEQTWSRDGQVSINQPRPLPATVASVILDVSFGG